MNRSSESNPQPSPTEQTSRPVNGTREGNFSGRLKALSISDVLEFLRVLNRCGTLALRDSEREVSLQVRDGMLIAAAARGDAGRLAGYLFGEGQLTREQLEAVQEREAQGERVGRILIETGILTPKGVWESLRRQARAIALGLFDWDRGEFQFREGEGIAESTLAVDLPLLELIADGIRSVKRTRLFAQRMPSGASLFEAIAPPERKVSLPLEPHERYVLGLIDGSRSLSELTLSSELGEPETLRVIFLLFSVGYLKMRALPAGKTVRQDPEALPVIRRYNEMYSFLRRYLVEEVGPIGDAVMGRYFEDQKKSQPALLGGGRLGRDGSLDEGLILRNLSELGAAEKMETLVDGLNELLYAELLAVRRTLGTNHEGRAVQGLRELGLQPVIQPQTSARDAAKE
jgi:uncharacterized protein DUF4388